MKIEESWWKYFSDYSWSILYKIVTVLPQSIQLFLRRLHDNITEALRRLNERSDKEKE